MIGIVIKPCTERMIGTHDQDRAAAKVISTSEFEPSTASDATHLYTFFVAKQQIRIAVIRYRNRQIRLRGHYSQESAYPYRKEPPSADLAR